MRLLRLFLFTIKDYVKRPFMWVIFLSIPVISLLLKTNENKINEHSIQVGYIIESTDDYSEHIISLVNQYDGLYEFVRYDDQTELENDVSTQKLECGYIFPNNIKDRIIKNSLSDSITVVVSPGTTMEAQINETIYSFCFPIISKDLLINTVLNDKEFISKTLNSSEREELVNKLFNNYYESKLTFKFVYKNLPDNFRISVSSLFLSPLRGIISIMILLAGFCGALNFYKDSENPIFKMFKVRFSYILIPCLLTLFFGIISLFIINDSMSSPFIESLKLSEYTLLVVLFILLISYVIKNEVKFAAFIPVFLLGCFVFTPIFIDITQYSAELKYVSYLFLPYYYLCVI